MAAAIAGHHAQQAAERKIRELAMATVRLDPLRLSHYLSCGSRWFVGPLFAVLAA